MARITWGSKGRKAFEAGLDRGVLHVDGEAVVPWSGLVSVAESPKGSDVTPFYQDGFRRYNYIGIKEFEATLNAFGYPDEFGQCEGISEDQAAPGLFVDQQPPKTFNLSYRTGIGGNVSTGVEDYKLHLVYNCSVTPSSKTYNTLADAVNLAAYSWNIVTVPNFELVGVLPSAHLAVDSTKASASALQSLENILYGTSSKNPRFPDPLEVKDILSG